MIKTDCLHFPLDRPCRFHKENGVHCLNCSEYRAASSPAAAAKKILIVKIGAMGDVLRTTFLLRGLKQKFPGSRVTWIVAPSSAPVLETNPFIHRIWPYDGELLKRLPAERFDAVINLDLSPESLALATLAFADRKIGFWLDEKRRVCFSNSFAQHWLNMSAFDDVKRNNERTYQYWMSKIAGLPRSDYEIYVPLVEASLERAKRFAKRYNLAGKTVVGINPGAGRRWRLKKWTDEGYLEIIRRLDEAGAKVLLLGGPEEKALVRKLIKSSPRGAAISTGTDNSIPDFFALVNLCDVVLAGDTMALHAALGLKKKALAIFGPTSAAEIEMYGRGEKIVSSASCVCCYRPECDVRPDCMKLISPDTVWKSLLPLVKTAGRKR